MTMTRIWTLKEVIFPTKFLLRKSPMPKWLVLAHTHAQGLRANFHTLIT